MAGKIVMCHKCGKNFEDTDGEFEQSEAKPVCPECKAKANGKFARISRAISEKAGAAGQAIAETYKEIGGSLLDKTGSLRQAASEKYRARQEHKAQEKAEEQQRNEEAEAFKASLRRGIIVTALQSVSCQVKKNLGYISANLYVELRNQNKEAITECINAKEEELLDTLRLKAHKLGANAVIGLNISKTMSISFNRTGFLLSAYGTALEIAARTKAQTQSPAQ